MEPKVGVVFERAKELWGNNAGFPSDLYVHFMAVGEDGDFAYVEKQGQVVSSYDSVYLVQLFDFVLGFPSCVENIKKEDLEYFCLFYNDERVWLECGDKYCKELSERKW